MSRTIIRSSLLPVLAILSAVNATCPNGTHELTGNYPPGICLPGDDGCPAGTFRDSTYALPWYIVTQCLPCPSGFNTFSNHTRLCRREGYPCPDGYHEIDSGDCWRCHTDEYFDLKQQRCISCPTGSGAAAGLSLWCAPCSAIIKESIMDSQCFQYRVFVPQDDTCPPGSHVVYRDTANVPVCRKCHPGFFSDESNATECSPCPAGTVAAHEGADACIPCAPHPPYSAPNEQRTECIRVDNGCPPDREPAVVDGRDVCRSASCGNGDDSFEAAVGRVCGPCSTAPWNSAFVTENATFGDRCDYCPLDTISDGLVCTKCPRGQVRTESGSCGCHGPLALTRGLDARGNCVQCPAGSYGVPGADGENVCTMCLAGSAYLSQTDTQLLACFMEIRCTPFTDLCLVCGPGTFSTEQGSLSCEPCPEGTVSYAHGAQRCVREGQLSGMVSFTDPFGNALEW